MAGSGLHAAPRPHLCRKFLAVVLPAPVEVILAAGRLARLARRAGSPLAVAASWLLLLGTATGAGSAVADSMERPPDPGTRPAVVLTLTCVVLLLLLSVARAAARRRGRRRWRETAGRMTPPGPLTPAERARQLARLDALMAAHAEREYHLARIAELERRLDAQDEAWAAWAREHGEDDTRPQLRLVDGDSGT